jgi:hypothetical protein
MFILDVLESLVNAPDKMSKLKINIAPDKMSKLKINIPSGYLPLELLLRFVFHIIYYLIHVTHCLHFCFSSVLIQVHLVKVTLHYWRARMKDILLLIYLNKGS